jgi:multiple sugar transport system ATP-binding protein
MSTVEFEKLTKIYPGGIPALSDCTLQIDDGELMVLVGPSGCGKSTLLRLLAGLETATGGTIRIGGRIVNELTPQERNVAMVFQDYALYPHMTVRQNLEFPLKMRRLSRAERIEKTSRAAGLLEIGDLLDRLPKQLSGGQRQRVAMGRALVREPTVFLLDEPLSNLDARLRTQVRTEIAELQRRIRTTMIYVTHDQSEAMTLGQRVAVLHQGRLQQVGTPRALYDHPSNVFVAGFIGNPPMNLFPARLTRGTGVGVALIVADQTLHLSAVAEPPPCPPDAIVTAGIRPEALRIVSGPAKENTLRAETGSVECLGHETLVHALVAEAKGPASIHLVVRVPGMTQFTKGEPLQLQIDPQALHLFAEPVEGQILAPGS